jgi:hypothetical protein
MAAHLKLLSVRGLLGFLFTIITLFSGAQAHAQNCEIRGTIYDKDKGEPLIYTTVTLLGTGRGAVSDLNGIYNISKLKEGTYHLQCSYLGYDTFRTTIVLTPGKKVVQNIYLTQREVSLNEVRVEADRSQHDTRVEISKISVTPQMIQTLPSVGGEPDLAQYLQILPGVVSTGDQGGQLYIRGGSPVENKVLLDGMTIYNPFHSIGLFSVFDPEIIKNVNVYTGGFDASYGGRVSSVMDVSTRDGDQGRFGGVFSVSPFASKLELEGPMKKFTETGGGSSFLFSARNSYLAQTAPVFYPYAGSNGLPYDFMDLYGKLSFNAPGGSKFDLFGFNFTDNVKFNNASGYNWNSTGAGGKVVLLPPSSSTIIEGHFSYSNYDSKQINPDTKDRHSSIGGFQGGLDFTYYPGKDLLKYGFEVDGFQTDFDYYNTAGRLLQQQSFTTELSGYVHYNKVINRLILDPSLRMQYYASLNEFSFEPRMGMKFIITDKIRFKAAGGMYSQNLLSATSDRDVVNLFYGFLTAPDVLKNNYGTEVASKIEKAWDVIGGFEFDIARRTSLTVEGYYKAFPQIVSVNENKLFDDLPSVNEPAILKNDFIVESGKSYGADVLLTYDRNPYYLWVTYSYSIVTHNDSIQQYSPLWDRRHSLNILGAYRFGDKESWEVSLRWAYGSGFPFTQTQGYYELNDFQQGGIGTDYTKQNGKLGIAYAPLDGGRLSDYHRLDASVKKILRLKKHSVLKITASVTNVYDRPNVFYFDRVNYVRVNQLPIMPSLALNYSF